MWAAASSLRGLPSKRKPTRPPLLPLACAQAVRPFIDPNTQKKIHFIAKDKHEAEEMKARCAFRPRA